MHVSVIICQLPGSINNKMCTTMIYEYKFIIIHNYSPTSTPPQKHTMPEDRFLTNVLIYLTLGHAVRQAIEWNPLLKARVINSSAMLCAADLSRFPRLGHEHYRWNSTQKNPPHTRTHISKSILCLQITVVAPNVYVPTLPTTYLSLNRNSAGGN